MNEKRMNQQECKGQSKVYMSKIKRKQHKNTMLRCLVKENNENKTMTQHAGPRDTKKDVDDMMELINTKNKHH